MQFERLELLIHDKINDIKNKKVLIIGIGGVGGYSVEMLARCGIENITIVDNDTIDITNLNRQIITNLSNIGKSKVDEAYNRIKLINPNCNVEKINEFITLDNINNLFDKDYDYVIDACDTISVKVELIKICKRKNIKLISCMGTGCKIDPTKLKIMDIKDTSYDPIAKVIRKKIKEEKIKGKVMVVSSNEKNIRKVKDKIPSISTVPSVAGIYCASYVINDIIGDLNV